MAVDPAGAPARIDSVVRTLAEALRAPAAQAKVDRA